MAKKKHSNVDYISKSLTADEKKQFRKWLESDIDLNKLLMAVADEGLKISVSWDDYNDCYQSNITQPPEKPADMVYVLVSRGNEPLGALYAGLFKFLVLLEGNLNIQHQERGTLDYE